jgi:hypothetical protein
MSVLDLVNQPGFEYGLPPEADDSWFGLWCPLLDCFLLVNHDFKLLQQIQTLTLSKILTVIVKLDSNLHKKNVIDNGCASGWTVTNPEEINFTLVLRPNFYQDKIKNIMPSTLSSPEEVYRVQTWMIFVWRWIKYIDHNISNPFVDFTGFVLDLGSNNQLQKKIYQILLLEDDPIHAENLIKQLIA